jgi:outer membrane receptor protein involved in Fe transport
MDADFGGVNLTAATSYLHRHFDQHVDYTDIIPAIFGGPQATSPNQYVDNLYVTTQRSFSQEVRLASGDPSARFKWVLGGFYLDAKQGGNQFLADPSFPTFVQQQFGTTVRAKFGADLVDGNYISITRTYWDDKQLAGFADADLTLIDGLALSAGVRVAGLNNRFTFSGSGPLNPGPPQSGRQKETAVTPKVGINYKPSENALLYVSASKGYRAGGSNPPLSIATSACGSDLAQFGGQGTLYKSDSLWNYEVGAKSRLFGGRLSVDASAYHIDWRNIQQRVYVPSCAGAFIGNLGSAKSNGFDLSLQEQVARGLSLMLAVGYTSATFSEDAGFPGAVLVRKGEQVFDVSPWNITAAAEYNTNIASNVSGYVRVEDRFNSRNNGEFPFQNRSNRSFDPNQQVNQSRNELNVRVGAHWNSLDVSAFIANALNASPLLNLYAPSKANTTYGATTIRPLTVGVTGTYRW